MAWCMFWQWLAFGAICKVRVYPGTVVLWGHTAEVRAVLAEDDAPAVAGVPLVDTFVLIVPLVSALVLICLTLARDMTDVDGDHHE